MARKNGKHRARLNWIVTVLVAVVVVFCAFSSWQDKNAGGAAAPFRLPAPGFLQELLDEFGGDADMDNALEVAGTLPDAALEVHFINLDQADSILIRAPDADLLIDAGENNQGEEVVRYLRKQGVRRLQYVIGTHPHSDHIGGLDTVLREMKVDTVILPAIPQEIVPTTRTYTDLLFAIGEQGLAITPAKPGDTLPLGDGAVLELLGPIGEYQELNNMSVVSRLTYGDTSFLFTGDACTGSESDLLQAGRLLRADVLDVGHHGSDTSSSEEFLQAVSPAIAVISCGVDNSYGHPHREVVERLQALQARILRTDRNGTVVIASDGQRLGVASEQ